MQAAMDPTFTEYVRARQQRFARIAYLMCGDEHRAHDLVQEALVKLAGRWQRLADENPDAYVRRILYRDNISWWRRTRAEVVAAELPERAVWPLPPRPAVLPRPLDSPWPRRLRRCFAPGRGFRSCSRIKKSVCHGGHRGFDPLDFQTAALVDRFPQPQLQQAVQGGLHHIGRTL